MLPLHYHKVRKSWVTQLYTVTLTSFVNVSYFIFNRKKILRTRKLWFSSRIEKYATYSDFTLHIINCKTKWKNIWSFLNVLIQSTNYLFRGLWRSINYEFLWKMFYYFSHYYADISHIIQSFSSVLSASWTSCFSSGLWIVLIFSENNVIYNLIIILCTCVYKLLYC